MRLSILLFLVFEIASSAHAGGYECKVDGNIQGDKLDIKLNSESFDKNEFDGYSVIFKNYLFSVSHYAFEIGKKISQSDVDYFFSVDYMTTHGTLSLPDGQGLINFDCYPNN